MKPFKLHGVTVRPTASWSPDLLPTYRRLIADQVRKARRTQDDYRRTAEAYARWLAERDGIDLDDANHAEAVWTYGKSRHIQAVTFCRVVHRSRWSGGGYESREEIATVEIPNYDWQPTVTETTAPAFRPHTAADIRGYLESFAA